MPTHPPSFFLGASPPGPSFLGLRPKPPWTATGMFMCQWRRAGDVWSDLKCHPPRDAGSSRNARPARRERRAPRGLGAKPSGRTKGRHGSGVGQPVGPGLVPGRRPQGGKRRLKPRSTGGDEARDLPLARPGTSRGLTPLPCLPQLCTRVNSIDPNPSRRGRGFRINVHIAVCVAAPTSSEFRVPSSWFRGPVACCLLPLAS